MITISGRKQVSTHSFLVNDDELATLSLTLVGQQFTLTIAFTQGGTPEVAVTPGAGGNSIDFRFTGYTNALGTTLSAPTPVIELGPHGFFIEIIQYYINKKNLVHVFVSTNMP